MLERSWKPLGRSWSVGKPKRRERQNPSKTNGKSMSLPLGALLGVLLEASWGVLEASHCVLEASRGILGPSGRRLEVSWRRLGVSWRILIEKQFKKTNENQLFFCF